MAGIGIMIYAFFAPVTLTLTWWPSYTNVTRILSSCTGRQKMNFLCQGFRKLSYYIHTHIPATYIHTGPKTLPRRCACGNNKVTKLIALYKSSRQPLTIAPALIVCGRGACTEWSVCTIISCFAKLLHGRKVVLRMLSTVYGQMTSN